MRVKPQEVNVCQQSSFKKGSNMGSIYVINVVHAEPNYWDDELTGLDKGVSSLLETLGRLERSTGCRIPITWCPYFDNGARGLRSGKPAYPDTIDVRKDFFLGRLELGDEIGIHTHASDPREQHRFFKSNAQKTEAQGFPYPKTHAPGWFYLNGQVLRSLEEAKIEIDTGLLVGARDMPGMSAPQGKLIHKGILLQDASCRDPSNHRSFRPYHPSYEDVGENGDSSIVEIPVFFYYKEVEEDPVGVIEAFKRHWKHRNEVDVTIVQFFWHPWELLYLATDIANREMIDGYYKIFSEIATFQDTVFSTANDAAKAWSVTDGLRR